jgi:hypothetical protein
MELSIPIDRVNANNIFFVDKKKNIIVEGEFVKIVYSTEFFEMNGLYILVEFESSPNASSHSTIFPTKKHDVDSFDSWIQIVNRNLYNAPTKLNNRLSAIDTVRMVKHVYSFDSNKHKLLISKLCCIESTIIERYI